MKHLCMCYLLLLILMTITLPLNRRETADTVPANEQEQQIYKYVLENVICDK